MTGTDILDARTFQQQLRTLANTLALKVEREGPKIPLKPVFVSADITVLIRQALNTYDLFSRRRVSPSVFELVIAPAFLLF